MNANYKWPHAHGWLPTLIIMKLETTNGEVTFYSSNLMLILISNSTKLHHLKPTCQPFYLLISISVHSNRQPTYLLLNFFNHPPNDFLGCWTIYLPFNLLTLCFSVAVQLMTEGQASWSNLHNCSSASQLSCQCRQVHCFPFSLSTSFPSKSFQIRYEQQLTEQGLQSFLSFWSTNIILIVTVLLKLGGRCSSLLVCTFS